jgi:tetratricopeptide (TPR) repeat protein
MKRIGVLIFFLMIGFLVNGQKENSLIRKGNNQYEEGKFKEAEIDYRKALEINNANKNAQFNLGTAIYKNNNFEEAARVYAGMAGAKDDPGLQAKVFHNMGNSLLQSKEYEKSILAYKNALRNDPGNKDTKYNLEYAKLMLRQQQNQQNKQDQNKKDDKDKQDQKQDQQKKDQQQNQEKNQNQTPDQRKISKEDASRMLEALKNDEKKTQQKVKKQQVKVQVIGIEKDW